MLICRDRECRHRISISKRTNARCPECRKKMELYGEGEGQVFRCKCGYREKLSAFNKRMQNRKSSVSKREVAKYMKKQKKAKINPLIPL